MHMEIGKERTERMGAWIEAVSAAKQGDMSVRHMERLSDLMLEKFQDAFRRALVGEPQAKVSPITVRRKLGAGMV